MSIFGRLRANLNTLNALLRPPAASESERMNLALELPGAGDRPLWRMELQVHSEPQADGERLRLRAHFQTNFASALRPALERGAQALPPALEGGAAMTLSRRAGALAQRAAGRALQVPVLRAVMEPLLQHDVNTWVELNASSASLDDGAHELLPQSEKLAALGIVPRRKDRPLVESWAGEAPGGYAQVSLMQIDKQQLPANLQRAVGERPFQLALAMVNTVERKR